MHEKYFSKLFNYLTLFQVALALYPPPQYTLGLMLGVLQMTLPWLSCVSIQSTHNYYKQPKDHFGSSLKASNQKDLTQFCSFEEVFIWFIFCHFIIGSTEE